MKLFRKAILIIHGFVGNLADNEHLMNMLEFDSSFDVYAKTLPGHDKGRYGNCKYDDWIKFLDDVINDLINHGYSTIYIVGHSMGGVLGSIMASRYHQIKKLVLVNAAFDYINIAQNKKDILEKKDGFKYQNAFLKILRTSPTFVFQFVSLVKKYKNVIQKVTCDTLILQSLEDEIVPVKTAEYIYSQLASTKKHITYINEASHIVLRGKRKDEVSKYIRDYLRGGRKWKKIMKNEL